MVALCCQWWLPGCTACCRLSLDKSPQASARPRYRRTGRMGTHAQAPRGVVVRVWGGGAPPRCSTAPGSTTSSSSATATLTVLGQFNEYRIHCHRHGCRCEYHCQTKKKKRVAPRCIRSASTLLDRPNTQMTFGHLNRDSRASIKK